VRLAVVVGALHAPLVAAHTFVDAAGDPLATISPVADVGIYAPQAPTPTLVFSDAATFLAPRLSLILDVQAHDRVRLHGQLRADRGFDPGTEKDGDVRMDEYFVHVDLGENQRIGVRVGKFSTAFGGWVERHRAWDNPFIGAPALYEDVLPITDATAPADATAFAARRDAADKHASWVPVVWGPSYASGAALMLSGDRVAATVEVKNAALSARPDVWDAFADGFDTEPTVTAHLSFHPAAAWTFGLSASRGPYLQPDAEPTLAPSDAVDDFDQTTWGVDVEFLHRSLSMWAELVHATFEVPNVGEVGAWSGFVEAKQKIGSQLWLAARLNRAEFDDAPGADRAWNRDLTRIDLAIGYRIDTRLTVKLEWNACDQDGVDTNGQQVVAASAVMRF
jgi:hypothetical protein